MHPQPCAHVRACVRRVQLSEGGVRLGAELIPSVRRSYVVVLGTAHGPIPSVRLCSFLRIQPLTWHPVGSGGSLRLGAPSRAEPRHALVGWWLRLLVRIRSPSEGLGVGTTPKPMPHKPSVG